MCLQPSDIALFPPPLTAALWRPPVVPARRRGVAYAAGILAYKVTGACLDAPGAVSTNATLSAIRKAADAGADVINLSWGDFRAGGYADASYAAALTYAERKGSLVAVAAGNNGLMGPFFVEGGVSADDVLNVASVDVIVNVSSSRLQFNMPLNVGKEHVTSVGEHSCRGDRKAVNMLWAAAGRSAAGWVAVWDAPCVLKWQCGRPRVVQSDRHNCCLWQQCTAALAGQCNWQLCMFMLVPSLSSLPSTWG